MPHYRFEFNTYDTGCKACPFTMHRHGTDIYNCILTRSKLPTLDNTSPDDCPLERLDAPDPEADIQKEPEPLHPSVAQRLKSLGRSFHQAKK